MERHEFRAMGTDVELMLDLPPGPAVDRAFAEVEREFGRIEKALFRASSPARSSPCSTERARSRQAPTSWPRPSWRSPRASERADASTPLSTTRSSQPATTGRSSGCRPARAQSNGNGLHSCGGAVEIDRFMRTIKLAAGVRLDLGGIGKGYAVDRAAVRLSQLGPCLVDAGGDIALRGRRWPVGVETANGFITLELVSGALATSGRDRRRWQRNGEGATSPDRSGHGPAVRERSSARHRRRQLGGRGRSDREIALSRGRDRTRPVRRSGMASPGSSSPRMAAP